MEQQLRGRAAELAVPAAAVAIAATVMAAFWFRRAFQHDDFFFAYLSWMRTTGAAPVRDYAVPSFAPFAEIFTPLFARLPESLVPLDVARGIILITTLLLLYVVFALTRALSGSTTWSLTAVALTAWEPNFAARVADIRSDPLSCLALLTAALLLLRGRRDRAFALAGVLTGAAATLSFKFLVFLPFVVIGGVIAARRERVARRIALLILGMLAAPILYAVFRIAQDGMATVLLLARDLAATAGQQTVPRTVVLIHTLKAAPLLWLAAALGACGTFYKRDGVASSYAVLVILSVAAYIAANPFLYPYNFVVLAPLVAPLVPGIEAWLPNRAAVRATTAGLLCAAAVVQGAPAMAASVRETNFEQRRLIEWVWTATAKNERIFDWQGMHFGRQGIHHWWIFSALIPRYRSGTWYSLADEWQRAEVTLMIDNYRFGAITPSDREWLEAHYVFIAPCVLAPGHVFTPGSADVFEVVVEGDYQIVPPSAAVMVDSGRVQSRVHLTKGKYRATGPQRFALVYTTPLREAAGPPPCPRTPILFTF